MVGASKQGRPVIRLLKLIDNWMGKFCQRHRQRLGSRVVNSIAGIDRHSQCRVAGGTTLRLF